MDKLFSRFKSLTQYVSDLHLERGFARRIKAEKPFLILAGDIGNPNDKNYEQFLYNVSEDFDKVFVLSGNHEYDFVNKTLIKNVDDKIEDVCSKRNNLFFLQKKSHLICKQTNLYVTGCTLWSKLPRSKTELHIEHEEWLKNVIKKNQENNYVIATHHCPLFECIDKKTVVNYLPNYFASDQSEIIKMQNVVAWVHGHSHLNRDILSNGKWILSKQYGYFRYPLY